MQVEDSVCRAGRQYCRDIRRSTAEKPTGLEPSCLEAPRRLARWGRLGPWHGFSNQNPRNWDKFLVSVPERETLIYLFLFIPKALFPSTGDRLGIWTLGNSQMSDNGSRQP